MLVSKKVITADTSRKNLLCGLSRFVTWHGPQAEVHGSPFLLQEHRSVLQELKQLQ